VLAGRYFLTLSLGTLVLISTSRRMAMTLGNMRVNGVRAGMLAVLIERDGEKAKR
jgi:hypothetical protein